MEHPTAPVPTDAASHAPDLRRRADQLGELARSIERSLVMTLIEPEPRRADGGSPPTCRTQLGAALLERNLHQLHRAADDLRVTAMRFRERADELEAAMAAVA